MTQYFAGFSTLEILGNCGMGGGDGYVKLSLEHFLESLAMITKKMDHASYQARLRTLSVASLYYIKDDASNAMESYPDNPNNGYYADEVNYALMELRRRGVGQLVAV